MATVVKPFESAAGKSLVLFVPVIVALGVGIGLILAATFLGERWPDAEALVGPGLVLCFLGLVLFSWALNRHRARAAGEEGERQVAKHLEALPASHRLLNNLRLLPPGAHKPLEIDHLVLANGKAWVVETKLYSGTVSGDPNAESWDRQKVSGGGNVYMSKVRNPIRQNSKTIGRLRRTLENLENQGRIPKLKGYWFESLVALPDSTGVSGPIQGSKELAKASQVVERIQADQKAPVLREEQVQQLAEELLKAHVPA